MAGRARVAVPLGIAATLLAAVVLLRDGVAEDLDALLAEPTADPAGVVVVEEFAAPTVTLAAPGPPPERPGQVRVHGERGRLRVAWDPSGRVAGYQVRWSTPGDRGGAAMAGDVLVTETAVELTGLQPGRDYRVQVRAVDAVGRASPPAFGSGPLAGDPDTRWQQAYGFLDGSLDPDQWRAASAGRFCLRAGSGTGPEAGRVVLTLDCGTTTHTLIPPVPLRLAPPGSGELGRVAVVTDAAGSGGTLSVDLVPGPADVVGSDPGAPRPPAAPGTATEDSGLPPGTIRVLLDEDAPTVLTGPGVPRTGAAPLVRPARQAPGVTHRFEVVLREDGLLVLRDGVPLGSADVLAPWPQARVLLGFTGPPGGSARIRLDAVGISGAAAPEAPGRTERDVVHPASLVLPGTAGQAGVVPVPPGATSAQLRALLRPGATGPLDDLTAVIGTAAVPVRPAVAGTAPVPGSVYPVVADVPAELLDTALPRVVLTSTRSPGAEVLAASLLFGGAGPGRRLADPPPAPATDPAAPAVRVQVLDTDGQRPRSGRPLPRGHLLVDLRVDAAGAQRLGPVTGLAGIELALDGRRIAAVPTALEVPAIGGTHRVTVRTVDLAPGPHTVTARAVPADPEVTPRRTEVTVQLA